MADPIVGDKKLERKLNRLTASGSRKAVRAGIRAGMTPIARAMRVAINATDASVALKRAARKSIGKRFAKSRFGVNRGATVAKVGFAVGKKRAKPGDRGGRPGVGVSSANIHWFVLGTDDRQKLSGAETGEIDGIFEDVTDVAFATSQGAALAAARQKIWQVVQREARR